ncbi:ArsR/SmtB family transcription factor [Candidatus Hodarchaeum mangrovi]
MNNENNNFDDEKKSSESDKPFEEVQDAIQKMKKEIQNELNKMKEEIRDIKYDINQDSSKYSKPPRTQRKTLRRDWEETGNRFGESIQYYIGSLLESVGESLGDAIDKSVGSLFHESSSRKHRRTKRKEESIKEEEFEEFFDKGSAIMTALSDSTRLRMLKELEREPLRQSDLADRTGTKGGNFKHHISILIDQGLVRQEGVRERYLLTFAGREALKLVEFLFIRGKRRLQVPVIINDEEEE